MKQKYGMCYRATWFAWKWIIWLCNKKSWHWSDFYFILLSDEVQSHQKILFHLHSEFWTFIDISDPCANESVVNHENANKQKQKPRFKIKIKTNFTSIYLEIYSSHFFNFPFDSIFFELSVSWLTTDRRPIHSQFPKRIDCLLSQFIFTRAFHKL